MLADLCTCVTAIQATRTAQRNPWAVCSAEEARVAAEEATAARRDREKLKRQLSRHNALVVGLRAVVNQPGLSRQVQSCVPHCGSRLISRTVLLLHRYLLSCWQLVQSRRATWCLSVTVQRFAASNPSFWVAPA